MRTYHLTRTMRDNTKCWRVIFSYFLTPEELLDHLLVQRTYGRTIHLLQGEP